MTMLSRQIPPISKQFFDELDKVFKFDVHHISTETTPNEIHQAVGRRQVVEWCRKYVRSHEMSSDVETIVKP